MLARIHQVLAAVPGSRCTRLLVAMLAGLPCLVLLACSSGSPDASEAGAPGDPSLAGTPGAGDAREDDDGGDSPRGEDDDDGGESDAGPIAILDNAPGFPPEVRSLRLRRSIVVRIQPSEHAERYGTIAADTRVAWKRVTRNEDCNQRWVEIEPYGWICEVYLEPSPRLPRGVELPRLEPEEKVPGVYGKVVAEKPSTLRLGDTGLVPGRELTGSIMIRRYGDLSDSGVRYWLIDRTQREYLAETSIREYRPSDWHGTRLQDDTGLDLPLVFPVDRSNVSHSIPVYSAAQGGHVVGRVRGRSPLAVLEVASDPAGKDIAYRVGPGQWLRAGESRIAQRTAPPPLTEPLERWIDIDLDQQVLVAYEGELPTYVTLVSTGARKTPTETGIYRVWVKFAETDMSDLAGESPYSVATVPWTQFYAKDLALHTSYWHDTFGTPRSHGCTNLSPADARYLYFWSEPEVPPGWSMAKGTITRPGSLVRLRSKEIPEPEFRGHAARVYEARRARLSRDDPR